MTCHGIYVYPAGIALSLVSVVHLWAALGCGVFSCHSNLVWPVGQKSAMAAAVNLQRDAGFMMSNLQILAQFVMSLHRMSSEMLSIGVDHVVFPVEEVDKLSVMPRAQRAAKYMTVMGLWRPPSGPGAPGPLPTSTCPSCMNCEYCFGRKETSNQ